MADPLVPCIEVMYAVRSTLESGSALASVVSMPALKIRWTRNRYTSREERPCLAIAFVADEPADDGSTQAAADELVRILSLDLVVDMEVETEASAETNEAIETPVEEYDPSGLAKLAFVLTQAETLLKKTTLDPLRDTTDLGRKCDWIQAVTIDDDEDLPDDDGRLVGRINVIYRVSSVDPMVLLGR